MRLAVKSFTLYQKKQVYRMLGNKRKLLRLKVTLKPSYKYCLEYHVYVLSIYSFNIKAVQFMSMSYEFFKVNLSLTLMNF